jgi:hypothetical protein
LEYCSKESHLIQFVTVYLFLSCLVVLGLFLIAWGWRLRSQCISMESKAPDSLPDVRFDEETELVDLTMSSEDTGITGTGLVEMREPQYHAQIGSPSPGEIEFERSGFHDGRGDAMASSKLGRCLLFLRNKVSQVLAILNRIGSSETASLESGAPAEFIPVEVIGALNRTSDENGCIARHGGGLSPQAPRSFRSYMTRRRSRFNVRDYTRLG